MNSLIAKNKKIHFGAATIRGTRINVTVIKSFYKAGEPIEMIMKLYDLTEDQVKAAINFKSNIKV